MKIVILLLLAANLVFAMWSLWVSPSGPPDSVAGFERTDVPRLVLLAEFDERLGGNAADAQVEGLTVAAPEPIAPVASQDAPDVAGEAAPGPSSVPGDREPSNAAGAATDGDGEAGDTRVAAANGNPPSSRGAEGECLTLGPFRNLREATVATSRLRTDGFDPTQRLAESEVWMGFWVHIPDFETRAAAVEAVERLRASGVNDLYIEPGGEYRNWVSLGVFSDRARADSHAARIRGLGIETRVQDRYRTDSVYWVDFRSAADSAPDVAQFAEVGRDLSLESRPCE